MNLLSSEFLSHQLSWEIWYDFWCFLFAFSFRYNKTFFWWYLRDFSGWFWWFSCCLGLREELQCEGLHWLIKSRILKGWKSYFNLKMFKLYKLLKNLYKFNNFLSTSHWFQQISLGIHNSFFSFDRFHSDHSTESINKKRHKSVSVVNFKERKRGRWSDLKLLSELK